MHFILKHDKRCKVTLLTLEAGFLLFFGLMGWRQHLAYERLNNPFLFEILYRDDTPYAADITALPSHYILIIIIITAR